MGGQVTTVKITFSDKPGQFGEIKVADQSVIANVFTDYKNGTLTSTQFEQLQKYATVSGKQDVLEADDVKGISKLKNQIASGDADYESWYNPSNFFSTLLSQTGNFEDEIIVKVPTGTTLGEVKRMYNLPDGSLTNYAKCAQHAPGNRDLIQVDAGEVWFSLKGFAEGNGMTVAEVKALFDNK